MIEGFSEKEYKITERGKLVYDGCHVKAAVNACADTMKIKRVYILGERFKNKVDKWRTWFWIKP